MGTFHRDKSPLHGITVVVETRSGDALVGRCEDENDRSVILLDADVHSGDDEMSRSEYLERADRFGVWPKHRRLEIARTEVARLFPLGQLRKERGTPGEASHR